MTASPKLLSWKTKSNTLKLSNSPLSYNSKRSSKNVILESKSSLSMLKKFKTKNARFINSRSKDVILRALRRFKFRIMNDSCKIWTSRSSVLRIWKHKLSMNKRRWGKNSRRKLNHKLLKLRIWLRDLMTVMRSRLWRWKLGSRSSCPRFCFRMMNWSIKMLGWRPNLMSCEL